MGEGKNGREATGKEHRMGSIVVGHVRETENFICTEETIRAVLSQYQIVHKHIQLSIYLDIIFSLCEIWSFGSLRLLT